MDKYTISIEVKNERTGLGSIHTWTGIDELRLIYLGGVFRAGTANARQDVDLARFAEAGPADVLNEWLGNPRFEFQQFTK